MSCWITDGQQEFNTALLNGLQMVMLVHATEALKHLAQRCHFLKKKTQMWWWGNEAECKCLPAP